jgi:TRAP-type C4-dicarboxylate transport system substrate-binding protein
MKNTLAKTALSCAIAGALGIAPIAQAQNSPVTMRIASYLPNSHYLVEVGLDPWMAQVTAETKGMVKFQHFPAQQLGKAGDMLRLAQTNVAQGSFTGVSFAGDKMELSDVAQLPNIFEKACDGTTAYMKLFKSGVGAEADFDKNGVRLVYPMVLPPFQAFTHTHAMNTLADFKGLKMLSATRAGEILLTKLGAAPTRLVSGPQAFEAFQRKTSDGMTFALDSVFAYDMQNMTKFGTENLNFGGQVVVFVMNKQAWNSLSKANQEIIERISDRTSFRMCAYLDGSYNKSIERLHTAGVKMTKFPAPALAEFRKTSDAVAEEWAKDLDKRGRPGTATIKAFRAALPKS